MQGAGKASRGRDGHAKAIRVKKGRLVHYESSTEHKINTVRCNKNNNSIMRVQQTQEEEAGGNIRDTVRKSQKSPQRIIPPEIPPKENTTDRRR